MNSIKHSEQLILSLPIREGAYGVLIRAGCVLLSHTVSGTRTIINFPGGALDRGESAEQALIREMREEAGGSVAIIRHLSSSDGKFVNPDYPTNRLLCHYYLVAEVEPLDLTGNSGDVQKLEWFPLSKLPFERMLDVDAEFCRALPQLL